MARITIPPYVPVPNGAGFGEAFQLGSGLAPLNFFRQNNELNERRTYLKEQAKQKADQDAFKDFSSASARVDVKGYLPWQKQITGGVPKVWDQILEVGLNPALNQYEKKIQQDKIIAQHNALVATTKEVEKKVNALRSSALSDKRYKKEDIEKS